MGRKRKPFLPSQETPGFVPAADKPPVPFWMVRAAIRALASRTRSTHKMGRADLLLVLIERSLGTGSPPHPSSFEEQQEATELLEKLFGKYWDSCLKSLRDTHSLLCVLKQADSAHNLCAQYPFMSSRPIKQTWLRQHLPEILRQLALNGCNGSCPKRVQVGDDELAELTFCSSATDLADAIVAHYHGTTLGYLRQLYYGPEAKALRESLTS